MADLEDLLKQVDIVDYIYQFVELEEKNGEYWGLSPFKDEKTPSFSVRRETGSFYDFSSGIAGNVLTFIRYYFRCSRRESLEKLKEFAGVGGVVFAPREKMAATDVCKRYLHKNGVKKQANMHILPDDYMLRYEKRDDKLAVWENEGISRASIDKFQVFYDGFSDRLVYPIRDMSGKIVNVGGRTLDPGWKEKGLRKYSYFFSWGTLNTIYGAAENADEIKKSKEIILFEGCKSVLLADSWGIRNCGAVLTSHLSVSQMKLLAKLGCRTVFALDKEVDITKDHNIQKLRQFVNVEYVCDTENLLDLKDAPVDKGRDVFIKLYSQRKKFRMG